MKTFSPSDLRLAARRLPSGGFTAVELVVVILILGVLAAAVLPRLSATKAAARADVVQAVAHALRDAAQRAHASWSAQTSNSGLVAITLSDGSQASMWHGYPDGGKCCSADGIEALIDTTGFDVVKPDDQRTRLEMRGAAAPASCSATYTEATNVGDTFAVSVDTSGC